MFLQDGPHPPCGRHRHFDLAKPLTTAACRGTFVADPSASRWVSVEVHRYTVNRSKCSNAAAHDLRDAVVGEGIGERLTSVLQQGPTAVAHRNRVPRHSDAALSAVYLRGAPRQPAITEPSQWCWHPGSHPSRLRRLVLAGRTMTEKAGGTVDIRTPDQRLRVFVSSTLVELADERAVVARAISTLGLTPVLFELGARPHPPRELYRAYLAQSDIFIGLYWQRYGWIGPDMEISGLEDEFRSLDPSRGSCTSRLRRPSGSRAGDDRELQAEGPTPTGRSAPAELGRLVRDDLALLLSEAFTRPRTRGVAVIGSLRGRRACPRSLPVTDVVDRTGARDCRGLELLQSPGCAW